MGADPQPHGSDRAARPGAPAPVSPSIRRGSRGTKYESHGDKGLRRPGVFEQREVPKPVPLPKQVLVRVVATSVNQLDYQIRRGDYKAYVKPPAILGSDVLGIIEAVGDGVTDFTVGDEVYYTPQIFNGDGSYAEYHVADESIAGYGKRNSPPSSTCCAGTSLIKVA
jgi:NADPH2:quinone reductase